MKEFSERKNYYLPWYHRLSWFCSMQQYVRERDQRHESNLWYQFRQAYPNRYQKQPNKDVFQWRLNRFSSKLFEFFRFEDRLLMEPLIWEFTLSNIWHKIIWWSIWIFSNVSTFMSSHRVEISRKYFRGHFPGFRAEDSTKKAFYPPQKCNFPLWISNNKISQNFFDKIFCSPIRICDTNTNLMGFVNWQPLWWTINCCWWWKDKLFDSKFNHDF